MDHALANLPAAGEASASRPNRACAECMASYTSPQPGQLFCCPAHRTAFQDRMRIRGRQLVPFEMADRATRGGSRGDTATGIRARQTAQALKDRWNAEDREAGRMSMVEYVRRFSKHFEMPW